MLQKAEQSCDLETPINKFYKSILPSLGMKVLAIFKKGLGEAPAHNFYETTDELLEAAHTYNKLGKNVYHACASYKEAINRKGENVCKVKTLWIDLDVGPTKPYSSAKEAAAAFEQFRTALGLPLTHVVQSGSGVHQYVAFTDAIDPEQWDRVAGLNAACMDHFGVKHDSSRTTDKASILRIPGTQNYKTDPAKNVKLIRLGEEAPVQVVWKALTDYAKQHGIATDKPTKPKKGAPKVTNNLIGNQEYLPATGEKVAERCPIIAEVDETGGDVSYEIWWRSMGIAKHTTEPEEVAIRWTRNREATDHSKFDWQGSMDGWTVGPTTCDDFSNHSDKCDKCIHKGHIKTPLHLGQTAPQADSRMDDLNNKYAWIEEDAAIYRLEYADYIEPAKFKIQNDNQTVEVGSGRGARSVGLGTFWLRSNARRQHKSLVLRPGDKLVTQDNCLNEWQGFNVAPSSGNIKPFLQLILRLIPNRAARRYVLRWLAHLTQHPDRKMHVSLAFWSMQQGVGKNLLFECVAAIIGPAHATLIGQAELASSFNGWASRKILVIGDEVSNSDRRQDTDKLKGLVTGTTIYINEKYQPAREVPNLLNFIFLSNHNDALFLDDQDRRYFVWEITADRLSEADAGRFIEWRDGGGLAALHYFLKHRDISNFNPKAPAPMTDAKQQMVQDNRSDLESWMAELMGSNVAGQLGRELATGNELARRYASETQHKEPSSKTIVAACKRHGAVARTNQVRMPNGKKLRVLALVRPQYWIAQSEADWAQEMTKPFKLS